MEQRIKAIMDILDLNKAEDIEVFDLSSKGYVVNQVVIATARNNKHSFALLDHLRKGLKPLGEEFLRTEEEDGEWIIIDLGDIFIHLMTQTMRDKYTLEDFLTHFQPA